MVTRPMLALMGMLALSLGLTGCKNCCSWGCKDGQCDTQAQVRKLPPICDGSCSHHGHAPTTPATPAPQTAPPQAQANAWYNPPTRTQVSTPAMNNVQAPQTVTTTPAPIAISQPVSTVAPALPVRTPVNSASNLAPTANSTSSAVTPASGTQPEPMRTWPEAEGKTAISAPAAPAMNLDTPAAAPAPLATSPASSTPMPARPTMLPPATEPTLPMATSTNAQPTRVETQYHEVPAPVRTPELPPVQQPEPQFPASVPSAPELPPVQPNETTSLPAPAAENPLMLPPSEER